MWQLEGMVGSGVLAWGLGWQDLEWPTMVKKGHIRRKKDSWVFYRYRHISFIGIFMKTNFF